MDSKDKLRVLLAHWIEHNKGHGEECAKWASISEEEGLEKVAEYINEAITAIEKTNTSLEKALNEAGGAMRSAEGHHHHHHQH